MTPFPANSSDAALPHSLILDPCRVAAICADKLQCEPRLSFSEDQERAVDDWVNGWNERPVYLVNLIWRSEIPNDRNLEQCGLVLANGDVLWLRDIARMLTSQGKLLPAPVRASLDSDFREFGECLAQLYEFIFQENPVPSSPPALTHNKDLPVEIPEVEPENFEELPAIALFSIKTDGHCTELKPGRRFLPPAIAPDITSTLIGMSDLWHLATQVQGALIGDVEPAGSQVPC